MSVYADICLWRESIYFVIIWHHKWASQAVLVLKSPTVNKDLGWIPGLEDPLEEGMATASSILAQRISRAEEPSEL